MHGRTDFAHGHSSEKIILGELDKQARSFGLDKNLRALAFASAEDDRMLRRVTARIRTTAMRIALKTEFPWTKTAPQQQSRCGANNRQRNQLLPIHVRNII